ncbi:MAG: PepSY domain-containing protein, partial [Bacteroidota bacterium]
MLLKIWRTSHLLLACIVSVFFLAASVSGIILAFEPIQASIQSYSSKGGQHVPLADLIERCKEEYEEVFEIEVLDYHVVKITALDSAPEKDGEFIIDPHTAQKIGALPEKPRLFQVVTNFHRSLFLKTTGRALVGIISLLFLLIIVTGILLLVKRDGGFLSLFKRTLPTNLS